LSSSSTPSIARRGVRSGRLPSLVGTAAAAAARDRRPKRRGQLVPPGLRHRVVDQLRHAQPRFDRVVVGEVQLWNRVKLQPMRQLGAQIAGGVLQRLDRFIGTLLAGQMREQHLRMRQVG
jgi:hypothetical protein